MRRKPYRRVISVPFDRKRKVTVTLAAASDTKNPHLGGWGCGGEVAYGSGRAPDADLGGSTLGGDLELRAWRPRSVQNAAYVHPISDGGSCSIVARNTERVPDLHFIKRVLVTMSNRNRNVVFYFDFIHRD